MSARRDQLLGLRLGCLFPKAAFSFLTAQEMLTKGLGTWERQKEKKKFFIYVHLNLEAILVISIKTLFRTSFVCCFR